MRKFYGLAIATGAALADCLTIGVLLLTGLFVALASQMSSPNYPRLFQTVTAVAALHIPFGVLYCMKSRWLRALVAAMVVIATLSYVVFALRMLI